MTAWDEPIIYVDVKVKQHLPLHRGQLLIHASVCFLGMEEYIQPNRFLSDVF